MEPLARAPLPPGRLYRMAWIFYLVLALAGCLWIGLRQGEIPLALFVDRERWWLDAGLGLAAGALLLGAWGAGRQLLPMARELEGALAGLLGALPTSEVLALAALSGFSEELFFRGAVQGAVEGPAGLALATLLFALLHTGPGRAFKLWTAFAAVAGLVFGGLMLWRGNLLAPALAHALVNAVNLRRLARAPTTD